MRAALNSVAVLLGLAGLIAFGASWPSEVAIGAIGAAAFLIPFWWLLGAIAGAAFFAWLAAVLGHVEAIRERLAPAPKPRATDGAEMRVVVTRNLSGHPVRKWVRSDDSAS